MAKTKPCTVRAIKKYNSKFDRQTVILPKGTKEYIRNVIGMSVNSYIVQLIEKDMEQRNVGK